eukprot:5886111-Amphidinium_carterae.1
MSTRPNAICSLSRVTLTLPWSFFASLLMTILLCIHYSYFGSTMSPLATARQSFATMATSTTEERTTNPTMAPGPLPTGVYPITGRPNKLPRSALTYKTDSEHSSDSETTIARDIRDSMEIIMWNTLISPQCSPIIRSQLHRAGTVSYTHLRAHETEADL